MPFQFLNLRWGSALGRRRRGGLSLVLVLLGAGLAVPVAAAPITLQLKWRHQFQFAGYYAAEAQGYYRQAGLEVRFEEAQAGLEPVAEVVAGRAQYGVGSSALLLERLRGRPVVVLAAPFQHSPLVLIAREDAGITSVRQLAGRPVELESEADELLAYLKQEGATLPVVLPGGTSVTAEDLIQGRADAISAYATDEPYFLDRLKFRYRVFRPRSAGIDFYGDVLFTSAAELQAHPDQVAAFRAASMRGWRYAMEHPEAVADLILSRYSQRHSREHLLFEARQMAALIDADLVDPGYMHPGRWQRIGATYASLGLVAPGFNLDGFIYDPEARDQDLRRRLRLALVMVLPAGALLGVAALVFLHLNRRLRREVQAHAQAAMALQENEQKFRFIAEHSVDGIWTMDLATRRFTYVSPSVFNQLGFTVEEVMARPGAEILTDDSLARIRAVLAEAVLAWRAGLPLRQQVLEIEQPHKDGHRVAAEVVLSILGDGQGVPVSVIGVNRDITERKRAERELRQAFHEMEQIAGTDPLTSAWNRRRFDEAAEAEMHRARRYGQPLALMMLDIDHFKAVNDRFGHAVGDRVLRHVADRIRDCIRISDSLTRWGGEEFLVLMPNTGLQSGVILAERVREHVAALVLADVGTVTVSLGLAEYLPSGEREAWLARVDAAMYRAKAQGRNRVEADPERSLAQPMVDAPEGSFLQLVWSRTYLSGQATIDAQHEELFHLANELLDAVLTDQPSATVLPLAETFLAKVAAHFRDEEAILEQREFTGLAQHRLLHQALLAKAQELDRGYRVGDLPLGTLLQFLAHDVVAAHLLREDRDYFPLFHTPGKSG